MQASSRKGFRHSQDGVFPLWPAPAASPAAADAAKLRVFALSKGQPCLLNGIPLEVAGILFHPLRQVSAGWCPPAFWLFLEPPAIANGTAGLCGQPQTYASRHQSNGRIRVRLIHLRWTLLNITVQLCSDSILFVSNQNGGIPQSFE